MSTVTSAIAEVTRLPVWRPTDNCDILKGVTPAQLTAYAAVVRHGASKPAAEDLGVTEAAISNHISSLRKELHDKLFRPSSQGLIFTPGGLRLASRAVELLGLQEQTRAEVLAAGDGNRLLRLAVSSLFAEYSAPGLIELFSTRAKDLRVEMAVHPPEDFGELLQRRSADLALGPLIPELQRTIDSVGFVRYQLAAVVASNHQLAGRRFNTSEVCDHNWLLGPSAIDAGGVGPRVLAALGVPEEQQLVFQSSEAALSEARNGQGIAFALAHRVTKDLKAGRLSVVDLPGMDANGTWTAYYSGQSALTPAAAELLRFVSTPRAMQAVLSGSAAHISRFKPGVHVTLWS